MTESKKDCGQKWGELLFSQAEDLKKKMERGEVARKDDEKEI